MINKYPTIILFVLEAFTKGLSLFYLVLLPIFYTKHIISSFEVGTYGALSITTLLIGAIFVTQWLHAVHSEKLLRIASSIGVLSSIFLLSGTMFHSNIFLLISYLLVGFCIGIGRSGTNAVAAYITTRGNRYGILAQSGVIIDVIRMVFPIVLATLVGFGEILLGSLFIFISSIIFFIFTLRLPRFVPPQTSRIKKVSLWENKKFHGILIIEFLDSLASSQLFVFLPLLFLAKGYSLQDSLFLQSFIFLGYLVGRFFVSLLAKHYSGVSAIAFAEICMVITILGLLIVSKIYLLYILSFLLGIFGRGTSPAIKGLSLDSLEDHQIKKGSAAHVVAGDSGSALGQLMFGVLFALMGASAPFVVSAFIALFVFVLCTAPITKRLFK